MGRDLAAALLRGVDAFGFRVLESSEAGAAGVLENRLDASVVHRG